MKIVLKLLGKILLVLVILIAVILTVCFFYQKSAQKKDSELLEHDGFCNLVSAGDYDMNLNIYGDGDITVVAMPGNGDAAFTIDMKVFDEFSGLFFLTHWVKRPQALKSLNPCGFSLISSN